MNEQKEKTAFETSAGTDEKQPLINSNISINENTDNFNLDDEDYFEYFKKVDNPNNLDTITMNELFDTVYSPKAPIIDGLLYRGVYLFAGAPKVGKSFAMAQLGYHISVGKELWGKKVRQGTVLYLALEDNNQRLQSRLSKMFGVNGNDNFRFATVAHNIGTGLEGQLEKFVTDYSNVSLIIIDTLQKVRECGNDKFSYANDYQIVTSLKKFADRFNLCVLLVHHTRKQEADDSFDTISGTNGLLGAADGAFILQKKKRTGNKATLSITGRDQQDQCLHLEFNTTNCIWELIDEETAPFTEPKDEMLDKIATLISVSNPKWIGTATSLIDDLGLDIQPNMLSRKLNVSVSKLFNDYGISYENNRTHEGRQIVLSLVNGDDA
jgi:RecA-family ATPase